MILAAEFHCLLLGTPALDKVRYQREVISLCKRFGQNCRESTKHPLTTVTSQIKSKGEAEQKRMETQRRTQEPCIPLCDTAIYTEQKQAMLLVEI